MDKKRKQYRIANIRIDYLPVITIIISISTILINYLLYIIKGHFSIKSLPSFSQTATIYPMSKIFAAGISLFAFLFFINGQIFCDYIQINDYSNSKFLNLTPIISILFTLTCCINKKEHPNIHGCCSCASFFFMLILAISIFRILDKKGNLQFKSTRFTIIIIGIISTIIIIITAPYTNSPGIHVVHAIVEYFMVFGLLIFFGLWYFDFKHIKVVLCIDQDDEYKKE